MTKPPPPPPLRVLVILGGGGRLPGGISTQVNSVLKAWEADPSTQPAEAFSWRVLDPRGARSVLLFPVHLLKSIGHLILERWRQPKGCRLIAHIHMASYASTLRKLVLGKVCRWLGVPYLLHLHGAEFRSFYGRRKNWQKRLIRQGFQQADQVLVLGQVWQDFVSEHLGVAANSITRLPNAVPAFAIKAERQANSLLFAGRLEPRKGTAVLLQALASLKEQGLPFQATLAGDGQVDHYRQQVQKLGLQDCVTLPGWLDRSAIRDLYAAHPLFILPSFDENLPMALLEAYAARMACISTPVGAIPEMMQDNHNGLLVPPGESAALAEALAKLLQDAALQERLSAAAYATWQQHYSLPMYLQQHQKLYAQLV